MSPRLIIAVAICALLTACNSPAEFEALREEAALEKSLMTIARASQNSRDYVAAIRFFRQIHEKHPDDTDATLGLARNLRYAGLTGQAVQVLKKSLAEEPENTHLRAELARALIASGEAGQAIKPLTEALSGGKRDWQTLSTLGVANDQLGRHDVARDAYTAALVLSPENVAVLNNLALSWAMDGDMEQALEILEQAVQLPGATPQTRQNLALLHGVSGNTERARELARLDLPEDATEENLRYYVSLRGGVVNPEIGSSSTSGKSIGIQLGSFETAEKALDVWNSLRKANPKLLGGLKIEFLSKKAGNSEVYVVWAGPLSTMHNATEICETLSAAGSTCRVVKR